MSWSVFNPDDPAVIISDEDIRLNPAARDLARLPDDGPVVALLTNGYGELAIGVAQDGEYGHWSESGHPSGWLSILAQGFIRQMNLAPGRYRVEPREITVYLNAPSRHLIEVVGLREVEGAP
jgi:hypothetical protein